MSEPFDWEGMVEEGDMERKRQREEAMFASPKLGFVKAVTEALGNGTDNWLLYMPRQPSKPGRMPPARRSAISSQTEASLREDTHDQLDAAHMRLCNDDSDVIRRIYREGM